MGSKVSVHRHWLLLWTSEGAERLSWEHVEEESTHVRWEADGEDGGSLGSKEHP